MEGDLQRPQTSPLGQFSSVAWSFLIYTFFPMKSRFNSFFLFWALGVENGLNHDALLVIETVVPICSLKKASLNNFAKFQGKHLRWSLFFNRLAGFKLPFLLKEDSGTVILKTPILYYTSGRLLLLGGIKTTYCNLFKPFIWKVTLRSNKGWVQIFFMKLCNTWKNVADSLKGPSYQVFRHEKVLWKPYN